MPRLLGCSLAAAPKVRDLIGQGLTDIQDVGLVMYPWSCLVCCAGFDSTATSLAEHAAAFLSVTYGGETPNPDMSHREPPRYVSDLLRGDPPIGFDEPGT